MSLFLGIDTSNYTTSAALYDSDSKKMLSVKKLLPVKAGEAGLRQSDAVFHHTKQLPEMFGRLFSEYGGKADITAIGVSFRPRNIDGSYMPCFLCEISNSNIKDLRFVLSFVNEIHSSEEWRICHSAKSLFQDQLLFICGNLAEQCLLIIIILITILVHLCIIFPVILMHSLNLFLAFHQRKADFCDTFF